MPESKMLNIGCGANYHSDWINLDVTPSNPSVLAIDITTGLPFSSEFATTCYSSHVLEHLDTSKAHSLVSECFRVLKSEGIIRLVLPDLEGIVREYLRILDDLTSKNTAREQDYDWIMLELYDQVVRNQSGGEMASFLMNLNEKDRLFVRDRIGDEAEKIWGSPDDVLKSSSVISLINKIRSGLVLNFCAKILLDGWSI